MFYDKRKPSTKKYCTTHDKVHFGMCSCVTDQMFKKLCDEDPTHEARTRALNEKIKARMLEIKEKRGKGL